MINLNNEPCQHDGKLFIHDAGPHLDDLRNKPDEKDSDPDQEITLLNQEPDIFENS